jgi:hypothetical protein
LPLFGKHVLTQTNSAYANFVLIWPILLYANKLQNSRNGLSEKAEWKGETQRKGQLRFDRMQTDREKAAENDKLFIIVILRQTGKNSLGGVSFESV